MNDEELAAIEARLKNLQRVGINNVDGWMLVAEVQRLKAQVNLAAEWLADHGLGTKEHVLAELHDEVFRNA